MSVSNSERRQIENEMIFRQSNEKVAKALDSLDALHAEYGNLDLMRDEDLKLEFKCECSDENCTVRIAMKLSVYTSIHADRKTFVIVPGHQVDSIEEVVDETPDYVVVKKKELVPEPTDGLNRTSVNNT